MQPEVAIQFEALWESSDSPPDVFAFLHQHNGWDASDKLAILLQDQRHRWQTSEPLKVEDYLAIVPDLVNCPDGKLKLAVGEFQARQTCDTSLDIAEFETRFADIRDSLRSRLSALASESELTIDGSKFDASRTRQRPVNMSETFLTRSTVGDTRRGRYRLERVLGQGAFGRVYLAFDEELRRQVAVKVPTANRFKNPEDTEIYLAEARTVASLDHPSIVPVYDVGRTDDGSIYVVSKFIEGRTLTKRVREDLPSHGEAAKLLAAVAQGLQHAHQRRIVHRDVKPGNILLEDNTGAAYIADFGLAIREEDFLLDSCIAGTPAYMSPEQARGEGHRLDGRSDIYSLGVVLYELLTGKRPFRGSTSNELLHQVVSVDPPDPRNLDDSIPAELERICLKALSKRASDRYVTAAEFANELLSWQQEPEREDNDLQIVPKGLRSFDADDADFYLDLLPGPRSRDGLPEDIRFWKTRIEETDSEKTFSIGLIYGPSGCGKSSLVKAGLLPRLSQNVTAIYLEATPNDTETRILRGLRKNVPNLPHDLGLVETFCWLRQNEVRKIVIVLDQFEQWLHAHRAEQETKLVSALRHCDGGKLQAVVMIRDDFSMAASRFMRELETRILEGHNFATVDLFDVVHAGKVLTKFGQAFAKLPAQTSKISDEQQQFVDAVASGLAQDGKVVSVRLALFAEMVKGKPWLPDTLDEVGGTEGIGANFLEEMFGRRDANPEHLHHQQAARQVLMALLPEVGSDIKGHMRSHAELLEVSQYQDRRGDFNELLRILDGKLRLITPTDPKGFDTESASDRNLKFYQLTHDYLVPSLREWLTRKQQETRRGRTELMLAERSALWNDKPESRHLPSSLEWAKIRFMTDRKNWTEPQRKMMTTARRVHGVRATMLLVLLTLASLTGLHLRDQVIEVNNQERATGFVTTVVNAKIDQIPGILEDIRDDRKWVDPKLIDALSEHPEDSNERLNISLALLPSDAGQIDYLKHRLLGADPEQVDTIRSLLVGHKDRLVPDLWRVAEQPLTDERKPLLQAVSALALYDTDNDAKWMGVADRAVESLVKENSTRVAVWIKTLKPARRHLIDPLGVVYLDKAKSRPQQQIDRATDILEEYAADDLDSLAELLLTAEPMQFTALFDKFAAHGKDAQAKLNAQLQHTLSPTWRDPPIDPAWTEPSADVLERIEQAHGTLDPRFAFCQTMAMQDFPSVVEELRQSGYRPIRFRPYTVQDSVQVAAAWSRDGRDWRLASEESLQAILEEDEQLRSDGFVPVDVAGYIAGSSRTASERFAALWMKQQDETSEARLFAGVRYADVREQQETWKQSGYQFTHALQGFRGIEGQRKYCGVVSKSENPSTVFLNLSPTSYEAKEYLDKVVWDMDPGLALESGERVLRYAAVWNASTWRESRQSHGLSPEDHAVKCREMQADGFRIVSISAASIHGKRVTASVWHRPLIKDIDRESLARRQANAAVAAMRMGAADSVWPLLRHGPDPRLRTWIIHRLGPMGASPKAITKQLSDESDVSIRRALILILGEYENASQIDRDSLSKKLLELYRTDPDPGIHAAAEWVLRRWDKVAELADIDDELATGTVEDQRGWYLTKQGQTMVVIPGPVEFLMGSPHAERDRSSFEYLHRKRIDRSFALASKEVTVRQFQQFVRDTSYAKHSYQERHAPHEDCPQISVTWYEAAAYCRWLSEQEDIDEDQMCYPPIEEIKDGMTLPPDYLSRTGYRLPTEAEWEYACRASAMSSRYYGDSDQLLGQYAWYVKTSDDRTWPVASLKPNETGLFDMQGNVQEWCQERYVNYSKTLGSVSEDREDDVPLKDSVRRSLRGGSFGVRSSDVRSAYRSYNRPPNRYNNSGFRVTRTYDASPQ